MVRVHSTPIEGRGEPFDMVYPLLIGVVGFGTAICFGSAENTLLRKECSLKNKNN